VEASRNGIQPLKTFAISSSIAICGQFFHSRRKTNTAKKNCFASADSLSGLRCGMPQSNHGLSENTRFSDLDTCHAHRMQSDGIG
jgi:hypothetical protein